MKFGLDVATAGSYADPRVLAELAVEAEAAGWDGFFVWDGILDDDGIVDPWVSLAGIAVRTTRLRLGAFMTPLARRRPWKVARETVTLDYLSNGRLFFGAGLGFRARDFAAFGEEPDPRIRAEKLDEGLEILSRLWRGEPFSYRGQQYQLEDVRFLPQPIQTPRIPVWIAGGWPNRRPFRRAARWDGMYVMTKKADGDLLAPEEMREAIAYVHTYRTTGAPFDVAFAYETPSDPARGVEIAAPYAAAGVTWWLELIGDYRGPFEEMRQRIRSGPPLANGE